MPIVKAPVPDGAAVNVTSTHLVTGKVMQLTAVPYAQVAVVAGSPKSADIRISTLSFATIPVLSTCSERTVSESYVRTEKEVVVSVIVEAAGDGCSGIS